jgi:ADP-heptose:LPS heptosyltransferase
LEGLAGLIEGCDLVVSVGNATAHLSGALGQKTWVLLPYVAGWRWLHEGSTCPWYQSVRLYRQSKRDDWTSVLETVSRDLVRALR